MRGKKKAQEEVKGWGNKGGGADGSRDVTMCENIKCPPAALLTHSGIFNNFS